MLVGIVPIRFKPAKMIETDRSETIQGKQHLVSKTESKKVTYQYPKSLGSKDQTNSQELFQTKCYHRSQDESMLS